MISESAQIITSPADEIDKLRNQLLLELKEKRRARHESKITGASDTVPKDVFSDIETEKIEVDSGKKKSIEDATLDSNKPSENESPEADQNQEILREGKTGETNYDWQKRKKPEIIDAEFTEHRPSEIPDKNWQGERSKQIEGLRKELDQARKEYLEMDYKKRGMWDRVARFFGKGVIRADGYKNKLEKVNYVKGENGEMMVDDQDVAYMRALYENKLVDLKNAMLEDAKANGMKIEDLAGKEKFFEVESKVNLADEHDKIRVENSGRFANGLKAINQKWHKLPTKYKLGIIAGFGLTGAGVATGVIALSGTYLGIYTAAVTVRRAFMGGISGAGAATWVEGKAKKGRIKRAEKGVTGFANEMEGMSEQEKYDFYKKKTQELIFSADDRLQSYKNWDRIRLALGGAVAGIVGSGMAAEFIKLGWHKSGTGEIVSKTGHKLISYFQGQNNVAFDLGAPVSPSGTSGVIPSSPEISHTLPVHDRSSFEGRLIENLKGSGADPKETGGIAHRMTLHFAEEKARELAESKGGHWQELGKEAKKHLIDEQMKKLNLVHPGATIELSPDSQKIINFHDSPPSEWNKHPGAGGRAHEHAVAKEHGAIGHDNIENSHVKNAGVPDSDHKALQAKIVSKNPASAAELNNQLRIHKEINSLNQRISQLDREIVTAGDNKQYDLTIEKQRLETLRDSLLSQELRDKVEVVKDIRKEITGGKISEWNRIQNQPAQVILKQPNSPVAVYYNYIIRENPRYIRYIRPHRYEPIIRWTARLADYHHNHSGRFANFHIPFRRHW